MITEKIVQIYYVKEMFYFARMELIKTHGGYVETGLWGKVHEGKPDQFAEMLNHVREQSASSVDWPKGKVWGVVEEAGFKSWTGFCKKATSITIVIHVDHTEVVIGPKNTKPDVQIFHKLEPTSTEFITRFIFDLKKTF